MVIPTINVTARVEERSVPTSCDYKDDLGDDCASTCYQNLIQTTVMAESGPVDFVSHPCNEHLLYAAHHLVEEGITVQQPVTT